MLTELGFAAPRIKGCRKTPFQILLAFPTQRQLPFSIGKAEIIAEREHYYESCKLSLQFQSKIAAVE